MADTETSPLLPNSEPTTLESLQHLVQKNKFFNLLILICLPLGLMSEFMQWGDTPTFLFNMTAIIGLAKVLDLATDQLSNKLGQTMGALLNASFGNAVEVIVSIMALREGLTSVVQASLLGSVLSNLLLVLGLCFFMGGLRYSTQKFNAKGADINSSLLGVSLIAFILPAAMDREHNHPEKILDFSHGIAVLLLIIYLAFMMFQLRTHTHFFSAHVPEDPEELEESNMSMQVALGALLGSTIVIGICAEYLVSSIEGISKQWNISETFIGLILLPIVGNAAEHASAVSAAMRNKMDLAVGVSLGSSLQISLFVTPLLVIIAWIMDTPLDLAFHIFDIAVVFVTTLTVTNLIMDGESNWLEGFVLLIVYFIVAFAYWIY